MQFKKLKKGEYTGTLLSSLSKADLTRSQHKIFSKPVTIVNRALFVLNFFNLPQGNILTRAERHFEELKDTSLPLPIWYQDGFNKQWKSGKLILQQRDMLVFPRMDPTNSHGFLLGEFNPRGPASIQNEDETTRTPGGRNFNMGDGGSKDLQEALPLPTSTL